MRISNKSSLIWAAAAALKDDDIDVEVKNGVVRLTGTVDGAGERMTALTIARSTEGVKSVVDDLRIEQKG